MAIILVLRWLGDRRNFEVFLDMRLINAISRGSPHPEIVYHGCRLDLVVSEGARVERRS